MADILTMYPRSMVAPVPGAPGFAHVVGLPGFPFKATPNFSSKWPVLMIMANSSALDMNIILMSWDHAIATGFGVPAGQDPDEPVMGYLLFQRLYANYMPVSVNIGGYSVESRPSPAPDVVHIHDIYSWKIVDSTDPGSQATANPMARLALSSAEFVEGKIGRNGTTGEWTGYLVTGQRVSMGITRGEFLDLYRASALNGMDAKIRGRVASHWPLASATGRDASWLSQPAELWFHFKWDPASDVVQVGRWFGKIESTLAKPVVVPPGTGDKTGVPHAESYNCTSEWARSGPREENNQQFLWFEPVLEGAVPVGSERTYIMDGDRVIGDLSVVVSEQFLDASLSAQPNAIGRIQFSDLALGALCDRNDAAAMNAATGVDDQATGVLAGGRKVSDFMDVLTASVDLQQAAIQAAAN